MGEKARELPLTFCRNCTPEPNCSITGGLQASVPTPMKHNNKSLLACGQNGSCNDRAKYKGHCAKANSHLLPLHLLGPPGSGHTNLGLGFRRHVSAPALSLIPRSPRKCPATEPQFPQVLSKTKTYQGLPTLTAGWPAEGQRWLTATSPHTPAGARSAPGPATR